MCDSTPGLARDRAIAPAHRLEQSLRALVRLHKQHPRAANFTNNERRDESLCGIGKSRDANFSSIAADPVTRPDKRRTPRDLSQKLRDKGQNHGWAAKTACRLNK
jgi:hypothetical protein